MQIVRNKQSKIAVLMFPSDAVVDLSEIGLSGPGVEVSDIGSESHEIVLGNAPVECFVEGVMTFDSGLWAIANEEAYQRFLPGVLAKQEAEKKRAKAMLASAISSECQTRLAALAVGYPEGEVSSWPAQVKEAEALQADPQAATPLLSAIATARCIALADLAGRVLAKSAAYSTASGAIIGRRQALEDAVASAQTADDLADIDILAGWTT